MKSEQHTGWNRYTDEWILKRKRKWNDHIGIMADERVVKIANDRRRPRKGCSNNIA